MNYRLKQLSAIIGADEDVLVDAARIMGYRRVGPLLCLSREIPTAFVLEAWDLVWLDWRGWVPGRRIDDSRNGCHLVSPDFPTKSYPQPVDNFFGSNRRSNRP